MERIGSSTCRSFLVGLRLAYSSLSTVMAVLGVLGEETQTCTLSIIVAPTHKGERLNQAELLQFVPNMSARHPRELLQFVPNMSA